MLEAVRIFLAGHNAMTATHISTLDKMYSGGEADPSAQRRNAEIQGVLPSFGYDAISFQEALSLVSQLQRTRTMAQQAQQARQ